jgi:hypothetical protein
MAFTKIRETVAGLRSEPRPAVVRILVSLVLLAAGILILTAPNVVFGQKFDDDVQKIAAGWVGAVIGYWLA